MRIRTYNYRGKKLFEVVDAETNVPVLIARDRQADMSLQDDSGQEAPVTPTNHRQAA
jgi:hypothetical protein